MFFQIYLYTSNSSKAISSYYALVDEALCLSVITFVILSLPGYLILGLTPFPSPVTITQPQKHNCATLMKFRSKRNG